MSDAPNFDNLASAFKGIARRAPRVVGGMAVTFFKGNFQRQGWTVNKMTFPWKKRAKADGNEKKLGNRAILIKTGKLRRSIRIHALDTMAVLIGSDLPYSKIHNEGGVINSSANVRAHRRRYANRDTFRSVRGRTGKRSSAVAFEQTSSGIAIVKSHTRKMNTKMPKRRFLGPSLDVMNMANDWIKNEIDTAVKNWK